MLQIKVIAGLLLVLGLATLFGLWQSQKAKTAKAETASVETKLQVAVGANEVYTKAAATNTVLSKSVAASVRSAESTKVVIREGVKQVKQSGDQNEKEFFSKTLSDDVINIYNAYLDGVHDDKVR